MKGIQISWRNPSPIVRIALVAGVFGAVGLLGGLYVDLFLGGPLEANAASLLGALLGVPFGVWFERDSPLASSDGSAVRDSPDRDVQRRLDE